MQPSQSPSGPAAATPGPTAWESMEEKLEAFAAKQRESSRLLVMLAREQDALLKDMQAMAKSQSASARPVAANAQPQVQCVSQQVPQPQTDHALAGAGGSVRSELSERTVGNERSSEAEAPEAAQRPSISTWDEAQGIGGISNDVALGNMVDLSSDGSQAQEILQLPSGHRSLPRYLLGVATVVLTSRYFEPLMGFIILINAFNIGWTIDRELNKKDTDLQNTIEYVLLGIFIAELALRFFVHGRLALKQPWNVFDMILISVTVLSLMLGPILAQTDQQNAFVQIMQQLLILRMMRLLRLARAIRLVTLCRPLWKLVQGLKQCLGTMVSAFVIMFLATFFFACFGAEFITKVYLSDTEVGDLVETHFSTMPKIMLTLFQFISMDSISAFYVPLIYRSPLLCIYFGLLLVFVSIAMMNLVTALLVEDAISTTKMDNEMVTQYMRQRLSSLRPAFQELFRDLDTSGDGHIQIREMVEAIKAGLTVPEQIQDIINPGRMLDLFDAIDQDKSGDLTEDEFVAGLSCVAISEVPMETMQILHLLRSMRRELVSWKREMRKAQVLENLPSFLKVANNGAGEAKDGAGEAKDANGRGGEPPCGDNNKDAYF